MKTIKQAAKEYADTKAQVVVSGAEIESTVDGLNLYAQTDFEAGAKFAQQWISVEDESPEIKNKRYQIHVKYKSGIDIYDTLAIEPSICTKENLLEILNELNITHWRPIERK